jgi:hypothetical protein
MEAHEVAPHGGDGKRATPREEVKQRLFLNGVDIFGDDLAVSQGIEGAPLVFPDMADPPLARVDFAFMGAQVTLDLLLLKLLIEPGFKHKVSFRLLLKLKYNL